MQKNRKAIRRQLNVLEAFAVISFCLLIGLVAVISSPSLGVARFHGASDVVAVIGLVLVFGILGGGPAVAILMFVFHLYFDERDVYQTAWLDGLLDSRLKDAPEVEKWLGDSSRSAQPNSP